MKRKNAKRLKKTKKSRSVRGYYAVNKYNKSMVSLVAIKIAPYFRTNFSITNTLGIKLRHNATIANFNLSTNNIKGVSGTNKVVKSILHKHDLTNPARPAFEYFKTVNTAACISSLALTKFVLTKLNTKV